MKKGKDIFEAIEHLIKTDPERVKAAIKKVEAMKIDGPTVEEYFEEFERNNPK